MAERAVIGKVGSRFGENVGRQRYGIRQALRSAGHGQAPQTTSDERFGARRLVARAESAPDYREHGRETAGEHQQDDDGRDRFHSHAWTTIVLHEAGWPRVTLISIIELPP